MTMFGKFIAAWGLAAVALSYLSAARSTQAQPAGVIVAERGAIDASTTLAVRGRAEVSKPADLLWLHISVTSRKPDAQAALRDNSTRMAAVIKALKALGIGDEEYETERVEVDPIFSEEPYEPPPDWQAKLLGYSVVNAIRARTRQIDKAAAMVQAVCEAGADSLWVSFGLTDEQKPRDEAITAATANAKRDARTLADAAGVRLVRMRSIVLDDADEPRWEELSRYRFAGIGSFFSAPGEDPARPSIKPGDVNITATVAIVYEVAPKD